MTSYQTFRACRIVKATVNKTLILDTYSIIQHLIFINFISLTVLNGYQQSKLIKYLLILYGIDQINNSPKVTFVSNSYIRETIETRRMKCRILYNLFILSDNNIKNI